jgi:hypothetical protein
MFLFLIFSFFLGLPFVLLFRWLKRKNKKKTVVTSKNLQYNLPVENQNNEVGYTFMNDNTWKILSVEKKKEWLMDIEVIFREGKQLIKKEMIKQGFLPGSKIIDISYFTGLSEWGTTITHFLIQNEAGGEIRELSINIDLAEMKFVASGNRYYSSGQERYFYLKNRKALVEV